MIGFGLTELLILGAIVVVPVVIVAVVLLAVRKRE
jgi:hypothetical protein